MNLHGIVSGAISAINPWLIAEYQQSAGYTQSADGTQIPAYAAAVPTQVQRQPMNYKDLLQVSGINMNGEKAAFYVNGNWQGVLRPASRGGDIFTLPDGTVWLVSMTLEDWSATSGWCKVAAVMQNGA